MMTISSIEKEFDELFTNPATTDMRKMNLNGEPYPLASCKVIKSFYRQKISELIDEIPSEEREELSINGDEEEYNVHCRIIKRFKTKAKK